VCKKFVWVHMPKSGGTTIKRELLKHPEFERNLVSHPPVARALPLEGRSIFITLRDPFGWYESLWLFVRHMRNHQVTSLTCPWLEGFSRLPFSEAVYTFATEGRGYSRTVRELLKGCPENEKVVSLKFGDSRAHSHLFDFQCQLEPAAQVTRYPKTSTPLWTTRAIAAVRENDGYYVQLVKSLDRLRLKAAVLDSFGKSKDEQVR